MSSEEIGNTYFSIIPEDYVNILNKNKKLLNQWQNNSDFPHDITWYQIVYQYNVPSEDPEESYNVPLSP